MTEPLSLSLDQQFVQTLAKQLLQAWHSQKAATQWVMRQQLSGPLA